MASSPELVPHVNNDLRMISDALRHISRKLHDHTSTLEIAVEGRYASEVSDPRVRLLNDALHVSRLADLELGRLNQALQRVYLALQESVNGGGQATQAFEQERAELTTSITRLEQRTNEQQILYEIARTLNSTLEFDTVLRLVMDRVIRFVHAERGFLMLVNPRSGELEFTIARDKDARTLLESDFETARISRGTIQRVIRTQVPVVTDDALRDDSLKGQESIMAYGIRSIMCAPLIVRDTCIGAVYVDSRINTNLFGTTHRDLLFAFCNQAAIAIDNARLFADLNRAIRQIREDKQYMENIFGSIANGVITTDSQGIITTFNAAAGMILGLNPMRVVGRHYQEIFATIPQFGLVEMFEMAFNQHDYATLVNRSVECVIPGRKPFAEISLDVYVNSLRDNQDDQHIGMVMVVDDRTALKRSQAQAKEVRRIFERYVHPNVVQQLIQDPAALNLGGETKEISVIFADIRGYTRLSETMDPKDVMDLINRYLQIMCEAIWEEEGTLTAFQGDALMAIFNAPLQQEDHALRAVRAAWKMRVAIQQYLQSQPTGVQVSFGFGVNTGLATVGNVGSHQRMQNYTAIGDVVNVASRLQNNVSDNDILINDSTYQQVQKYVKVGLAFPLKVKNKSSALNVRYLLGLV